MRLPSPAILGVLVLTGLLDQGLDLLQLGEPDCLLAAQIVIGQLCNDVNAMSMQLEEAGVFTKQAVGGLVEGVDVSLDVGRLVPGQLAARLHLCVHVSDALFEVLEFLEDHALLGVDDLLPHVVVEIGDFLQTQRLLVVSLPLLGSLDDLGRHLALEAQLGQLSGLSDEEDEPVGVIDSERGGGEVQSHHSSSHLQSQTLITVLCLGHLCLPLVQLVILEAF